MQVDVLRKDGSPSGQKVSLDPQIFGVKPNDHAIYQAVRVYLANQRQGTHKVKNYGEVSGSGKKLWKQKHTGRARIGAIRSPLWKGGGSIFGPVPRDYSMKLPKQMRQLARKSALSYKALAGNIKVVEDFSFEKPATKEMAGIIKGLGLNNRKVLLLVPATDLSVFKSGRNIPKLQVLEAAKASTYEIVDSHTLLLQKSAVEALQKSFTKE